MNDIDLASHKTLDFLVRTKLFRGITAEELPAILECLGYSCKHYKKGDYIIRTGDVPHAIAMVVHGSVQIESVDAWGDTVIHSLIKQGDTFAESFVCAQGVPISVSVVAASECDILMLNIEKAITVCSHACACHTLLVKNLVNILASKNIALTERTQHTAPRTIRRKVIEYLSTQSMKSGSNSFEIVFNRQQLADYLCVDRSALSAELGRMKREGLIDVDQRRFTLKI